jgi:hypothetical protein
MADGCESYAKNSGPLQLRSPSPVLESVLGFDLATNPAVTHPIWAVLATPRPAGLRLLTAPLGLAKRDRVRLPSYPVSLVLQFKCPEHLRGSRARQWHLWHLWHRPYYRFTRTRHQQTLLARLETDLADRCVVRYSAPAFHRMSEFEHAQLAGEVITRSGHVSPSELRTHQTWTYVERRTDGRGNPAGPFRAFATLEDVLEIAFTVADPPHAGDHTALQTANGFSQHLQALATSLLYRNPSLRTTMQTWAAALTTHHWTCPLVPTSSTSPPSSQPWPLSAPHGP